MRQMESFFWGIIAALGALVIELIAFIYFSIFSFHQADISFSALFIIPKFIILGVFIEESFKYIIISKCVERMSLGRSYIINSLFVGLGFFLTEIGLASTTGVLPRANILTEVAIIHIGTAGLIGYIIATKNPKRLWVFLYTLIWASFFHGSYNFLITNRTSTINYVIFALLGMLLLINILNIIRINKKLAQD